jgi:hypothetical protein
VSSYALHISSKPTRLRWRLHTGGVCRPIARGHVGWGLVPEPATLLERLALALALGLATARTTCDKRTGWISPQSAALESAICICHFEQQGVIINGSVAYLLAGKGACKLHGPSRPQTCAAGLRHETLSELGDRYCYCTVHRRTPFGRRQCIQRREACLALGIPLPGCWPPVGTSDLEMKLRAGGGEGEGGKHSSVRCDMTRARRGQSMWLPRSVLYLMTNRWIRKAQITN